MNRITSPVPTEDFFSSLLNRNADIRTAFPAIERITQKGLWVIRIGDPTMQPLPAMDRVVDYAHSPAKDPWLDIFLMASGLFFLGTTSGPWCVATAFGVPVAQTNVYPVNERTLTSRDRYIPKKLVDKRNGRLLPLLPILTNGGRAAERGILDGWVRVEDNSAEEIDALVGEMFELVEGRWESDARDRSYHQRLSQAASQTEPFGLTTAMGRDFLRTWGEDLLREK